jgi:hypothetical protein
MARIPRRAHVDGTGSWARCLETLLATVERLPAVTSTVDQARGSAEARVGTRLVARIDLTNGSVLVDAAADAIPDLLRIFPSSRPAPDGLVFDLAGSGDCSAALAAIRRQANAETLLPQARIASP